MFIFFTWLITALIIGAMSIHLLRLIGESIFLSLLGSNEQERRRHRD